MAGSEEKCVRGRFDNGNSFGTDIAKDLFMTDAHTNRGSCDNRPDGNAAAGFEQRRPAVGGLSTRIRRPAKIGVPSSLHYTIVTFCLSGLKNSRKTLNKNSLLPIINVYEEIRTLCP
jgi:hypothetical protein